MNEMRKKHQRLFIGFVATILLFAVLTALVLISSWNINVKLSLFLLLLILLLIATIWFRPRLYFHAMQMSYEKLKEHPHLPITTKHDLSNRSWLTYLTKKEFKLFIENESHVVFHRYTKDPKNFVTKNPMLEIIILIREPKMDFDNLNITKTINMLEDDYRAKKIKFTNYSLIQVKYGSEITDEMQEKVNQVVFDRQNGSHIIVINGYYETDTKKLYFLHSKKYVPSLYYKYVVDLFRSLVI
ncbi:MAG: hypothetical protein CVV58_04990 [Tenericutes bacterium HGW-Tenericutes-3]|nr:MAG: hypothetical protein CVV58_04990 [Tenericutes bacterium HGW-Tenericutes-3]